MLLRFSVENFKSFDKRAEFSMVANSSLDEHKEHVYFNSIVNVLRAGFIYGGNASGKSNLVKAIAIAIGSILGGSPSILGGNHFRINGGSFHKPCVFQFDFLYKDTVYSYGYSYAFDKNEVVEEWLYIIDKEKDDYSIFHREPSGEISSDINFTEDAKNRFQVYKLDMKTMKNLLFLSEMAKKQIIDAPEFEHFGIVFKWFEKIVILDPSSKNANLMNLLSNPKKRVEILDYVKHFDTGITNIKSEPFPVNQAIAMLPPNLTSNMNIAHLLGPKGQNDVYVNSNPNGQYIAIRKNKTGDLYAEKLGLDHGNENDLFDMADESDGTQRLIDLIPLLLSDTDDTVIVVDEIDRSLHPKLLIDFIRQYYSLHNKRKSQLIMTTHTSSLLDLSIVRKDEVWFVERTKENSSKLYSLDEFRIKYDASLEIDYLYGRYGGIPVFTSFGFGK